MRDTWTPGAALIAGLVSLSSLAGMAQGDEIKLKDGTRFPGSVLGRDGNRVVIGVPRALVEAIDGETLPLPVVEGTKAPAFSVVDVNGATQTLGSEQGKPTLIHFWASWCPHCRSDVPMMKTLFTKYHDKGLRLIAISIDQDIAKLTQFLSDQQLPYPVVPAFKDMAAPAAKLPDQYEAQGVPTYFLVDAKGVIAKTFSGSATEGKIDLESDVQKLLDTTVPPAAKPDKKS